MYTKFCHAVSSALRCAQFIGVLVFNVCLSNHVIKRLCVVYGCALCFGLSESHADWMSVNAMLLLVCW